MKLRKYKKFNKSSGKHTSLSIKKLPCRFENEGILNISMSDENYTKLLYKWGKSHEYLYGLDLDGYKQIKKLAMVDQIDISNPNTLHAKESFYLIMNERKNIRNKINKKFSFSSKTENCSNTKNLQIQDKTSPKRIFLKKKIVINNSGFSLNHEIQSNKDSRKSELESLKTSNFIPLIAKVFRKFKQLKQK